MVDDGTVHVQQCQKVAEVVVVEGGAAIVGARLPKRWSAQGGTLARRAAFHLPCRQHDYVISSRLSPEESRLSVRATSDITRYGSRQESGCDSRDGGFRFAPSVGKPAAASGDRGLNTLGCGAREGSNWRFFCVNGEGQAAGALYLSSVRPLSSTNEGGRPCDGCSLTPLHVAVV